MYRVVPEVKKAMEDIEVVEKVVLLVGVAGAAKNWYLTPTKECFPSKKVCFG